MTNRRRMNIQYGYSRDGEKLYWEDVKVIDAKKPVELNGTFAQALSGYAGETMGCHLSNCGWENSTAFPHPCKAPPVFFKTRCFVISKISGGKVTEVYKYRHEYGAWVDLNDTDKEKKFIKEHPELAERKFILYPPRKSVPTPGSHTTGNRTGEKHLVMPKGTMARMAKAGLIPRVMV